MSDFHFRFCIVVSASDPQNCAAILEMAAPRSDVVFHCNKPVRKSDYSQLGNSIHHHCLMVPKRLELQHVPANSSLKGTFIQCQQGAIVRREHHKTWLSTPSRQLVFLPTTSLQCPFFAVVFRCPLCRSSEDRAWCVRSSSLLLKFIGLPTPHNSVDAEINNVREAFS